MHVFVFADESALALHVCLLFNRRLYAKVDCNGERFVVTSGFDGGVLMFTKCVVVCLVIYLT